MFGSLEHATPLISVVLPTYNVEKYIRNCLESCVNQTLKNVEFIIVDDYGHDTSISIAEEFVDKDPRFRIIYSSENVGTFLARKKGINSARGKYVVFLDPDDSLQIEALEKLHALVHSEPVDIVFFSVEIFPTQPITTLDRRLPKKSVNAKTILKTIFCDTKNMSWGTPGKMYSRELALKALDELIFIKERLTFAEDVLFLFAAGAHAQSCSSLPEKLYIYNKNPESITEVKTIERMIKLGIQIDRVNGHLNNLSQKKELDTAKQRALKAAATKIFRTLSSDKELMKRFLHDPVTGKALYLKSTFNSYKSRSSLKDITRIVLYIISFTKFKF